MGHEEFATAVLESFGYLQLEFGLRVVESRRYSVIFENSVVRVRIAWDKTRTFEFCVSVSVLRGSQSEFSIEEIVACRGDSRFGKNRTFMAYRDSDVFWCIAKMSELLRELASDLLCGSPEGVSEMKSLRNKLAAEWQREELERVARLNADVAWKSKDFDGVVKVYEMIEDVLSPSERMKLTYARRQRTTPDESAEIDLA